MRHMISSRPAFGIATALAVIDILNGENPLVLAVVRSAIRCVTSISINAMIIILSRVNELFFIFDTVRYTLSGIFRATCVKCAAVTINCVKCSDIFITSRVMRE